MNRNKNVKRRVENNKMKKELLKQEESLSISLFFKYIIREAHIIIDTRDIERYIAYFEELFNKVEELLQVLIEEVGIKPIKTPIKYELIVDELERVFTEIAYVTMFNTNYEIIVFEKKSILERIDTLILQSYQLLMEERDPQIRYSFLFNLLDIFIRYKDTLEYKNIVRWEVVENVDLICNKLIRLFSFNMNTLLKISGKPNIMNVELWNEIMEDSVPIIFIDETTLSNVIIITLYRIIQNVPQLREAIERGLTTRVSSFEYLYNKLLLESVGHDPYWTFCYLCALHESINGRINAYNTIKKKSPSTERTIAEWEVMKEFILLEIDYTYKDIDDSVGALATISTIYYERNYNIEKRKHKLNIYIA